MIVELLAAVSITILLGVLQDVFEVMLACGLIWPERKRPDIPARLAAILDEEKKPYEPEIIPKTLTKLSMTTLLAIGATVVASIVAELVLKGHGFHAAP